MTSLADLTDAQLIAELARRGRNPRCRCQLWRTYLGSYDHDGYTWRCRGCLRAISKCTCG